MKIIASFILSLILLPACYGQTPQWSLENGKARLQLIAAVPGKDADYIYKQVNRWLISAFKNPEDILKARIESEYLRGQVHHSRIYKQDAFSSVDFQYTFAIDIKDEKVRLTLSHGILFSDDTQEENNNTNGTHPIESYLENQNKKKKDKYSEYLLASVNTLSSSLVKSFQDYVLTDPELKEDW